MVSSTLCPAVHILGSQNVYGRAEGIADRYWPWAVFLAYTPPKLPIWIQNLRLTLRDDQHAKKELILSLFSILTFHGTFLWFFPLKGAIFGPPFWLRLLHSCPYKVRTSSWYAGMTSMQKKELILSLYVIFTCLGWILVFFQCFGGYFWPPP